MSGELVFDRHESMTDYTKLVEALRCELHYTSCPVSDCNYICHDTFCDTYRLMVDAADAIDALQAEVDQWKAAVKGQEDGIKVLQAEVERLKADVDAAYAH